MIDLVGFRAGDGDLYSALHANLTPHLGRVARSFGLGSAEVADAVQDTWVRAFEQRSNWRGDGSLFSWLVRICRSVCVDQIRSNRADLHRRVRDERLYANPVVDLIIDLPSDSTGAGLRSQALADWIDDQIKGFPTCQRNVAALRWLLHWPVRKIAQTLRVTPGTVKTELFRARRTIARRLKDPQVVVALGIDQSLVDGYIRDDN